MVFVQWKFINVGLHSEGLTKGYVVRISISDKVHGPVSGLFFSDLGEGSFVISDHGTERAWSWLPCVDHPSVRTILLFIYTIDAGLTVPANEYMTSQTHIDGNRCRTKRWMDQITPSYTISYWNPTKSECLYIFTFSEKLYVSAGLSLD